MEMASLGKETWRLCLKDIQSTFEKKIKKGKRGPGWKDRKMFFFKP